MKPGRSTKLLVEPPSSATGDIAFNLIVFFLVCASVQPDSGRKQSIPRGEEQQQETQSENVEVRLARNAAFVNGNPVAMSKFPAVIRRALQGKTRPEDKVVVVRSDDDTTYQHWIQVTGMIEDAGGLITIQVEEERQVVVP